MEHQIRENISNMIAQGQLIELRTYPWNEWLVPDLAALLNHLDTADRVILFRLLPRAIAAEVFAYLDKEERNTLLKGLNVEETRYILANLSPDDRTALFEELPGQATQRMLNLLNPEDLKQARLLLGYPEESVGRLMTPDYVAVRPGWTIGQALAHIRARAHKSETIHTIYVTDSSWKLLDGLDLTLFILADPAATVETLMDHYFISLSAFDDREEAVVQMQKYDVWALPVVDSDGVLLGLVTHDDIMDVAELEVTEDFHRSAAVLPLKGSYSDSGIMGLVSKRIGWLLALVFISLLSAAAISYFENELLALPSLIAFIPMLIGTGGNAGAQAATLMVRALAIDDVHLGQWCKICSKEILVGTLLGLATGVLGLVFGYIHDGWEVGLILGLSMLAVVFVSNLIGVVMPFLLTRFKVDPAVASNPLITSITDILGLVIYFLIASGLMLLLV